MTQRIYIILCMLLMAFGSGASTLKYNIVDTPEDKVFIERSLREATIVSSNDNLVLTFARKFLGRPYVAHTLEVADPESLVVDTRRLDCTTLVENVTALTLCSLSGKNTYDDYIEQLASLRYRGGRLDGYVSRLHYFTEWIDDNQKRGWVSEVQSTKPPFLSVQTIDVWYMGRNQDKYIMLQKHPEFVETIRAQESMIKGKKYRYIPKTAIKDTSEMRNTVFDGDIIAITCNTPGLDIAHLGFAVWKKDGLHLLNASMKHKKVVEEPMLLHDYLMKHKSFTGIRVVRISK